MSMIQIAQNNAIQPQFFIAMQLSFSTADDERSIFHEAKHIPLEPDASIGNTTLLVVHGDMS